MCCLNGCQGHRDVPALTPAHTLTPFTTQHGACEKRGRTERRNKAKARGREAAFVTAETTLFVPQRHGGTRATNVKPTKARGTSMADAPRLPSSERQEPRYRGACLRSMRTEKQIHKQTTQQCARGPLHACLGCVRAAGSMEAVRLWLVPLQ